MLTWVLNMQDKERPKTSNNGLGHYHIRFKCDWRYRYFAYYIEIQDNGLLWCEHISWVRWNEGDSILYTSAFSFFFFFFFFFKRKDDGWHWPQSQDADQIGSDQASRCAVSELWEKSKVTHRIHYLTHTFTLSHGQEEHLFMPGDWFLQYKGDSLDLRCPYGARHTIRGEKKKS